MRCAAALKSAARSALSLDRLERGRRAAIAVFADERVDALVFAELVHAGREDDELGAVGQRHAGAVDGLVADPGGVKLAGIEIDDGLADLLVDDFEVDLEAEFGGPQEALDIVADVEAAHGKAAVWLASDDGEHIDDGQMAQEVIGGVVEHVAHGIDRRGP